jgi:hypothetical protein
MCVCAFMRYQYLLGCRLDFSESQIVAIFVAAIECLDIGRAPSAERLFERVVMQITTLVTRHAHQQNIVRLVFLEQGRKMSTDIQWYL